MLCGGPCAYKTCSKPDARMPSTSLASGAMSARLARLRPWGGGASCGPLRVKYGVERRVACLQHSAAGQHKLLSGEGVHESGETYQSRHKT